MLTDIVFVELPPLGKKVAQGEPMAVVESVKSVSDVYAPVSGEETPELLNQDAFGEGWIAKLKLGNTAELKSLFNAADYDDLIKEEKH